MKKFKVIYTDQNNITNVFKVVAEDRHEAVMILRKKINPYANVLNVIEVKDKNRTSWTEVNIVISCILAFILLVIIATTCSSCGNPEPVDYIKYVVQEGDSLWYIGSHSNGWNILDNNNYVINHIEEKSNCTSTIHPGQIVYIPVYDLD